jgi:hypothetical protein
MSNKYLYIEIITNIIIGLLIGTIIGYYIFNKTIYIGPDSSKIIQEIHYDEKGKYKWKPVITICPIGTVHKNH